MPNIQSFQFVLYALASLLFVLACVLGLMQMRRLARDAAAAPGLPQQPCMGNPARLAIVAGTLIGLALVIWRTAQIGSVALVMSNPFDAFLAFALLLALTAIYFCLTRHLRALSFFLLPMIVILQLIGLVLVLRNGTEVPSDQVLHVWTVIHVVTLVAATVCFALACVGGVTYLLAARQLRRKGLDASHRWVGLPSLESIEKFNRWLIYGGFPLLSISTVAGILRLSQEHARSAEPAPGGGHTKIAMGILSWLIYAVLLHVPLNPSFRGRRAAWLSIAGFILFIATFVAAYWK
jgi:ABC-type uncharacterized transport system permease subunit